MSRDEEYTAIMVVRTADCPLPAVPSLIRPCVQCGHTCWVQPEALFGSDFVELIGTDPIVMGKVTSVPLPRKIICMRCLARITGFGPSLDESLDAARVSRLKRGHKR